MSPAAEHLPIATAAYFADDQDLSVALASLSAADFPFLRWQTVTAAELVAFPDPFNPQAYDEAWAFGPRGEVHWARVTHFAEGKPLAGWRAVYVGARGTCPLTLGTPAQIDLADGYETGPPFTVKLWGERRPGQDKWLDLRIPRELAYPWPTADRFIGLTLIPYRQNGRVAFTRLTGLARWPAGDAL